MSDLATWQALCGLLLGLYFTHIALSARQTRRLMRVTENAIALLERATIGFPARADDRNAK